MTASVAPTAKPTSAAVRAAMSLMPSPQNMVVCPRPCAACSLCVHQLHRLGPGGGGGGGGAGRRGGGECMSGGGGFSMGGSWGLHEGVWEGGGGRLT